MQGLAGIKLEEGRVPWQPTLDTELVKVLDRYDMPTLGILQQRGRSFLFACVDGQAGQWSLWSYESADGIDLSELSEASSTAQFDKTLFKLLPSDNPLELALSHAEEGIVRHGHLEKPDKFEGLLPAASEALQIPQEEIAQKLGMVRF